MSATGASMFGAAQLSVFPAAAVASAIACVLWLKFAASRRLLDLPGGRRVHTVATPRGGGIGIALVMIASFAGIANATSLDPAPWFALATATALLAAMGLFDDLRPMRALAKFAAQLLAVLVMLWPLGLGDSGAGWAWVAIVAAVILWVNVWNFMDGSHGLVAVQALLIALALGLLPGQVPALCLASFALAGACLGFLPFNLPTARVFLGDVGSHAIAAAVIGLTLSSVYRGSLSLPEACMLSSVLWVDALITLVRRTLAGRTLWRAHREHLYQFAVRRGFAAWRVCVAYAALTVLAAIGVFAMQGRPIASQWGVVAAWFVVLGAMHALARRRLLDRTQWGVA